jgi:hypothetical protein
MTEANRLRAAIMAACATWRADDEAGEVVR